VYNSIAFGMLNRTTANTLYHHLASVSSNTITATHHHH
jgi:hypothetical protein